MLYGRNVETMCTLSLSVPKRTTGIVRKNTKLNMQMQINEEEKHQDGVKYTRGGERRAWGVCRDAIIVFLHPKHYICWDI